MVRATPVPVRRGDGPNCLLATALDFQAALQDVHDVFHVVNRLPIARGLQRLEEVLRPAAMAGVALGHSR